EFNASKEAPVHFLQIWIQPAERNTAPRYEQKAFDAASRSNGFKLIVAPDGRGGALTIGQDAEIHSALLDEGGRATHTLGDNRAAWLHVARGAVEVYGT